LDNQQSPQVGQSGHPNSTGVAAANGPGRWILHHNRMSGSKGVAAAPAGDR